MADEIVLHKSDTFVEEEQKQEKRIIWIDICKGILIISVILGHISGIPAILRSVIFSFHMPLIFIINGFLIHDYDIGKTFIKSSKSLLKPYFIICIIEAMLAGLSQKSFSEGGIALFNGLNDMVVGMSKISTVFKSYNSVWLVWFVGCLFVARNLYVTIRNITKSRIIQDIIILTVAFLGIYIGKNIAFLPWSVDVAMVAILFIASGNLLSRCKLKRPFEVVGFILALTVWIILLVQGAQLELATRKYPLDILCIVCAIAGGCVFVVISKGFAVIPFLSTVWAWLGKNSMVILAVHCLEMRFFKWKEWIYRPLNISPDWFFAFVIHTAFIVIVVLAFNYIKEGLKRLNKWLKIHETKSGNRLDWPDVAKGICIISVILGHLGSAWLNQIVFIYHLPVFFLISGYFLRKKGDEKEYIIDKAKRLLIPYAATCSIVTIIAVIQNFIAGGSVHDTITKWFTASIYGAGDNWKAPIPVNQIGAIWFLLAMFFATIIVHHFVERKYYQVIIFGIAFIGWASFNRTNVWLPLSIQAGMLSSLYLLIGYEARKNHFEIEKMGAALLFGAFLIMAFSIQHFNGFWLVHNYFGNGWLDFLCSLAASIVIIAGSQYICKTNEWLKRSLMFFGRNSLIILCAHLIDLNVLSSYIKAISNYISSILAMNANQSTIILVMIRVLYVLFAVLIVGGIKRIVVFLNPRGVHG